MEELLRHPLFISAFGALLAVLVGYLMAIVRGVSKKNKAMEAAMCAILRDRLIQGYNHFVEDKGWCPIYAKDSFDEMYAQYHNLGGNGTVTTLHEAMMELPTQKGESK